MTARVRPARIAAPLCDFATRPDGAVLVTPRRVLGRYPVRLTEFLEHWARAAPDRVFIAERDASGNWRGRSYGDTWRAVRAIGTALLARGLSAERPVAVLSGNGVDHALLGLACLARRHSLRAGLDRLFAAVARFRQAAPRLRRADTRARAGR